MESGTPLESVLKRDRAVVLAGLAGITALAWAYLIDVALEMGGMDPGMAVAAMPRLAPWSAADFAFTFVMWAVMMVAMMMPSAAPMLLLFATVNRKKRDQGHPFVPTGLFALGYLIAWSAFSLAATASQWLVESAALLSAMMVGASTVLGALLLICAGLYQWTPVKHACLVRCRSPLEFVLTRWREGAGGALVMGLDHGAYCVGCCWFLMGLLFVGGVMNLLWVAAIAAFVLLEKAARHGEWIARIGGALMAAAGLVLLIRA